MDAGRLAQAPGRSCTVHASRRRAPSLDLWIIAFDPGVGPRRARATWRSSCRPGAPLARYARSIRSATREARSIRGRRPRRDALVRRPARHAARLLRPAIPGALGRRRGRDGPLRRRRQLAGAAARHWRALLVARAIETRPTSPASTASATATTSTTPATRRLSGPWARPSSRAARRRAFFSRRLIPPPSRSCAPASRPWTTAAPSAYQVGGSSPLLREGKVREA